MADIRYFNGETALVRVFPMRNPEFEKKFGKARARRYDSFSKFVGYDEAGNVLPVQRAIEYKTSPSKHKCDARCLNAQGKTMRCECSCGGKNHGRGSFVCEAA